MAPAPLSNQSIVSQSGSAAAAAASRCSAQLSPLAVKDGAGAEVEERTRECETRLADIQAALNRFVSIKPFRKLI